MAHQSTERTFLDRIRCWEDTKRLASERPTPLPSKKLVLTSHDRCVPRFTVPTQLVLTDQDSIDCGLSLGYGVVVLNLADDHMPGGCVDIGSGAQEESLFRRTNLCRTLTWTPELYPIRDGEAVYSPAVTVFKASEQDGWRRLDDEPRISFLSVPGVKYPRLDPDGRLLPADAERVREQLRTVLRAAYAEMRECVVLGAMGCGAWRCPGSHVAELFGEVLPEFASCFKTIAIAIKRGAGDARRGNFKLFQEALFPEGGPNATELHREI